MAAKPGLRPFLPADTRRLAAILVAAVEELAADDYTDAQRAAWAAAADDEAAFGAKLAKQLTLVALLDGEVVGFAALENNARIDMLYVEPQAAGQGVATALVDALEKLAAARGASDLVVDASDTAEPFFRKRGYRPEQRNTVVRFGEWLANTTYRKPLKTAKPGSETT